MSHRRPNPRVHGLFQDPLYDPQPHRAWGRTNELTVPSQPRRE
jgi:hypothetical protein